MVRDNTAVYVNVAPEFGGGRLGPFNQMEIRFGCDNSKCHVFIPEQLGVSREHAKVLRQDDGSLIVTPAERTAAVFVWKGDARRPTQVLTPTALRSGDAISLVSPDGPKFFVEVGKMPVEPKATGAAQMRKRFSVGGLIREIQRVAMATLYTFSPVAIAARIKLAWESGLIFTPRFIVSAMLLLSGWIMAAPTGCAAFQQSRAAAAAAEKASSCQEQLDALNGIREGNVMSMNIAQLIGQLLTPDIYTALDKDTELREAVKTSARSIASNADQYRWIFEGGNPQTEFMSWRKQVEEEQKGKLDEGTKKLLPFLAAIPGRKNLEFGKTLDSKEEYVCARGPLRMTWRQGHALGLAEARLDAYTSGDTTDSNIRSNLLKKTAGTAMDPSLDAMIQDPTELESETVNLLQGNDYCVSQTGTDDRESVSKLGKMAAAAMGINAPNLPNGERSNNAGPARIARYFAADIPGIHFGGGLGTEVNFNLQILSNAVKTIPKHDWVMQQTAEVIARSFMLPCMAALQDKSKQQALLLVFGKIPDPVTCLVLNYRLNEE